MKLAIMQPYFFPYIGYFQLIGSVDRFVTYDDIKFTKKGWINRNRILIDGQAHLFTIPVRKDSDYLNIRERKLANHFELDVARILRKIRYSYSQAPFFESVFSLIEKCFLYEAENLFVYVFNSLTAIVNYLDIKTPLLISSRIGQSGHLKAEKRVISICKSMKADHYINPIGGRELYLRDDFKTEGITLNFLKSKEITYEQYANNFVPWLSIIDVMMFNSKTSIQRMLDQYELI